MNINPLKTAVQHKCHCCTAEKDIELCELENCEYVLCLPCKHKIYKFDNKCPCCRREIDITIYQDSSEEDNSEEDSSEEDSSEEDNLSINNRKCNKILFIFKYFIKILSYLILLFIFLCLGRIFTIMTNIGPSENFWFTGFEKPVLMFFIFSILGSVFIFCVFLLGICICKTFNDSLKDLVK